MCAVSGITTQRPKQQNPQRAASTGKSTNTPIWTPKGRKPPPPTHLSSDRHLHIPSAPRWTTPNLIRTAGAAVVALAAVIALFGTDHASALHSQIDTIGHINAPSATASSDFILHLQDMDAQLANALLINGDTTLAMTRQSALNTFEADRELADADLQRATAATVGNSDSQAKLKTVLDLFGTYEQDAAQAVQLDVLANGTTAGAAPKEAVAAFRTTEQSMQSSGGTGQGLLNAAKALETAATTSIDQSALTAQGTIAKGEHDFAVVGIVLLAALVFLQSRLFKTFRRAVNPGLAAASVVTLVLITMGYTAFTTAGTDLHNATKNAFDSVSALTDAEALSYDANADESRWLLDPANAGRYAYDFVDKSRHVADQPGVSDGDFATTYADKLGFETNRLAIAEAANPDDPNTYRSTTTGGFLGTELHNVTFPGEGPAAVKALNAYVVYQHDDAKLRAFAVTTSAGLRQAIDFDTNARTNGTSDKDFTAYTDALEAVKTINQNAFDGSTKSALDGIGSWSWLPYVFLVLIAGLVAVGLRPRLNEYR